MHWLETRWWARRPKHRHGRSIKARGSIFPIHHTLRRAGQVLASGGERKAESAFFASPNKLVEFYVFSPQWNGNPKDIQLKPSEKLVSQRTQKTRDTRLADGSYLNEITTRWFTARAKDGSYTRSWVDIENTALNTRRVFGFRYRDQKVYRRYLSAYTRFKNSLVQYAD